MKAATSMTLIAAIALAGKWSQDKKLDMKTVVGLALMAVLLSMLVEVNANLADQFGLLILLGASFFYLPRLVKGLGF